MNTVTVLKPGAQTQLQDGGRFGWQRFGVPVGGAMDLWSHRVANLLAGNAGDEATLEILLMGPSLRFEGAATIALCGADLSVQVAGELLPMHERIELPAGTQLDFGKRVNGLRCYLAVRGGFAVPPVMGSRSTFVRGGFGGFAGRALRKGDVLPIGPAAAAGALPPAVLPDEIDVPVPLAAAQAVTPVRVVPGEHAALFAPEVHALMAQSAYQLSPQSDRMGYRLEGPALPRLPGGELISEGVSFGTVQVPPDGQPIVLMAERQSAGGYPKIAHVASVDLPLLAQMAPRQALRFVPVSLAEAQALHLAREQQLQALRPALLGRAHPSNEGADA